MWIEVFDIDDLWWNDIPCSENEILLFTSDSKKWFLCFHSSEESDHTLGLCCSWSEWFDDFDILFRCLRREEGGERESTFLTVHRYRVVAFTARTEDGTTTTTHWRTTVTHTSIPCSLLLEHFPRRTCNLTTMLRMSDSDTTIRLLKDEKSVDKAHIRSDLEVWRLEVDCSLGCTVDVVERSFHVGRI